MNLKYFLLGARLKTLLIGLAGPIAGIASALFESNYNVQLSLLCIALSVCLNIAVNFSNDFSDGIRGVDQNRIGPARLVGSGLVPARQVKLTAFVFFALAVLIGEYIAITTNPLLLIIGALAILAAWFYTGGKHPYGYIGLGELMVFIFFGLVATLGTQYVVSKQITALGILAAITIGCFSMSVLLVNNLRDLSQDQDNGKITLAVRLGEVKVKRLMQLLLCIPLVISLALIIKYPINVTTLAATPFILRAIKLIKNTTGTPLSNGIGIIGKALLCWAFGLFLAAIINNLWHE